MASWVPSSISCVGIVRSSKSNSEWTRFGHLKEKPDPKTMAALTTTGKDGTKLSIETIGERTAMLADVRAHVSTMLVDLAELMMFVAQQK
jgi:hypothetical protein